MCQKSAHLSSYPSKYSIDVQPHGKQSLGGVSKHSITPLQKDWYLAFRIRLVLIHVPKSRSRIHKDSLSDDDFIPVRIGTCLAILRLATHAPKQLNIQGYQRFCSINTPKQLEIQGYQRFRSMNKLYFGKQHRLCHNVYRDFLTIYFCVAVHAELKSDM